MTNDAQAREDAAVLKVLRDCPFYNEAGDKVVDLIPHGRDALDFGSMGRVQLGRMLRAAYRAGKAKR